MQSVVERGGGQEGEPCHTQHGGCGQLGSRTGNLNLLQQAELRQLGQVLQQGLQAVITQGLAGQSVKQRI